jgi:hypothetical protein
MINLANALRWHRTARRLNAHVRRAHASVQVQTRLVRKGVIARQQHRMERRKLVLVARWLKVVTVKLANATKLRLVVTNLQQNRLLQRR